MEAFCFWENNRIGINLGDSIKVDLGGVDLTLEQAEHLLSSLTEAIEAYKKMDAEMKEYFNKE